MHEIVFAKKWLWCIFDSSNQERYTVYSVSSHISQPVRLNPQSPERQQVKEDSPKRLSLSVIRVIDQFLTVTCTLLLPFA